MLFLYNILQAIILPIFSPFLAIFILCSPKYRDRIPSRLGFGLKNKLNKLKEEPPTTYWIHALSVGEVTSAIPLVSGLREHHPQCRIVFSVTTKSGKQVADSLLQNLTNTIIDGPLDILPVVMYFYKIIRPDYFILVETDFWPNTLLYIKKRKVPSFLVNGRVSKSALQGYRRMAFFFNPMFQSFSALCMQTEVDRKKMESIGIPPNKIHTLGNLKFDTGNPLENRNVSSLHSIKKQLPENKIIFIAGSTHPGEEGIILHSYSYLRQNHNKLFLVIAPRDPGRAEEIRTLAKKFGFNSGLRTEKPNENNEIFILNTIGELAACYSLADISFVGGSLVRKGGHNPIEPAIMATPVLFGPHMEDFIEIANDLLENGGGIQVRNSQEMSATLEELVMLPDARKKRGLAAKEFVRHQQGVIQRHLQLIHNLS